MAHLPERGVHDGEPRAEPRLALEVLHESERPRARVLEPRREGARLLGRDRRTRVGAHASLRAASTADFAPASLPQAASSASHAAAGAFSAA